jgi:hypothetical protein
MHKSYSEEFKCELRAEISTQVIPKKHGSSQLAKDMNHKAIV